MTGFAGIAEKTPTGKVIINVGSAGNPKMLEKTEQPSSRIHRQAR